MPTPDAQLRCVEGTSLILGKRIWSLMLEDQTLLDANEVEARESRSRQMGNT
jgi:hypothetical protein